MTPSSSFFSETSSININHKTWTQETLEKWTHPHIFLLPDHDSCFPSLDVWVQPSLSSRYGKEAMGWELKGGFYHGQPFCFIRPPSAKTYHTLEERYAIQKLLGPWLNMFIGEDTSGISIVIGQEQRLSKGLSNPTLMKLCQVAEDIYFHGFDYTHEKNRWESFDISFTHEEILSEWQKNDPHFFVRQKRLYEYRKWINEDPGVCTSIEIGQRLEAFAAQCQKDGKEVSFMALDEEALRKEGMNLICAVGQASKVSPPRCYYLEYKPKSAAKNAFEKPLLLVGKGITFDTGGINVKPHASYVHHMRNDMGGAALMSQLFKALVEVDFPHPLVLAVPSCENLVDGNAMKPGSIVTGHGGKKVYIEHTDAEGRLILADAISYGQQHFQPRQTYVAATLTTAALTQFTNYFTPAHFLSDSEQMTLKSSGDLRGEKFAFCEEFLPIQEGNHRPRKGGMADLTNMGSMPVSGFRVAGTQTAAHFLSEFSSGPLIHFDIFATAWNWCGTYPGASVGATGAPFNSLFDWFLKES